jgi:hypothetical protein
MKFCCEKFQLEVGQPSTTAPIIRIVKFLANPLLIDRPFLNFFVTIGYKKFDILLPKLMISYCPYCGKELREFYKVDGFANESEGETF